jgi:hypothetical protein
MQGEQARAGGDNNGTPTAANYGVNPQSPTPAPLPVPATPPPPGAAINPNQQYVGAFQASLANQRQSIDSMLAANLQSLGARRDMAAKEIVAGQGQIAKDYATQTQQNKAQEAQAVAMQQKSGFQGQGGANANDALIQSGISQQAAGDASAGPLEQLATRANYDAGATTLQGAATTARSALDTQQQQFNLAQLAASQSQQQAAQAHAWSVQDATTAYNRSQAAAAANGGLSPTQADALFSSNLTTARGADAAVSKATGGLFPTTAALQQFAASSPGYGWASRAIMKGGGHPGTQGNGPTYDTSQVLAQVGDRQVVTALLASGLITNAQATAWVTKNPNA